MEVRLNDAWMGGRPNQWFVDRVNELIKPPYFGTDTSHEVPAADVIESEDGYHFYFEMPGVKGETISVRLEEGALIVEAERKRPEFSGKTTSHRSERNYRKYHRAFRLPEQYASQPVTASYKDGVLEVSIAKPAEAKPVKIQVNLN
ncbi:MAG TPA: Hsp20/alpha crystallin family protein [Candidatus Binataceae bacterium]|jgi:HSP20 family protein|nr:Hsp20/alpha crystallin family protein [Candidatus Binataceae bacterium]